MPTTYVPLICDSNGNAIQAGRETITKRFASVTDSGQALSLPVDCKGVVVHVEGSTVRYGATGAVSGSTKVYETSDGVWLPTFGIVVKADTTFLTVFADTGQTVNVSVWGVR
jgi:hypothetical protein